MPQIFHRSTNTVSKVSIFGAVFILAGLGGIGSLIIRSGYYTQRFTSREQPIPFSHKHHAGGLGIDCRFCHTSVETSSFAGIPPTKTCMGCHSQIWIDSPTLEPVRASFRTDKSIEWNRVHKVADFVYFNHSIHINKGVGCATCHGRVDQMPLMRRQNPSASACRRRGARPTGVDWKNWPGRRISKLSSITNFRNTPNKPNPWAWRQRTGRAGLIAGKSSA